MDDTHTSRDEDLSPRCSSVQAKRSEPEPSSVSLKSDHSMNLPRNLKSGEPRPVLCAYEQKSLDPESQCVVIKSGRSIGEKHNFGETQSDLRSNLEKKFQCLYEGTMKQGNPTLLKEIYTELYITEGESGEGINEHEVRQIEQFRLRSATEDTPIKCNDIFRPLPGQDKAIRTVLTKGVAGIGKTISVQKFILDWAEGKENQDVHLLFPLSFRELNLMKDRNHSLSGILHAFFPEIKEMDIFSGKYKVLFICDGLDECRLSLDFQSVVRLCDAFESASVGVLLTNLIVGNLLPSALIWITSRPAAAGLIPSEYVHRLTEIRGFTDPQKEEYFRKRLSDQILAERIISHLKSSRSLQIMCHIPVFCWISATVLGKILSETESGKIPKTLTQMYTHFLIIQTQIKNEKDYEKKVKDEDIIFKLGKLAFQQLVKGNVIFYMEDLSDCGIDDNEASVYSGLCTQIFREEFGLDQVKIFCFVHLSVQEHLAALFVHFSFTNNSTQVFSDKLSDLSIFLKYSLSNLHQRALDEALQSKNGHLDLFLRFLLGLSVQSNQVLLEGLMTRTKSSSDTTEETAEYIKKKIQTTHSPEKFINLFHCLNEMGDRSLVEEIQQNLKSGKITEARLSASHWSAVVFVMLTSETILDEFHLNKFVGGNLNQAEKHHILQKLLPVIRETRSVQLSDCGVTEEGCAALASVLRSNPLHLKEINMSLNKVGDSGVKLLAAGLKNPCRLEILKLSDCDVTDEGCAALALVLTSNHSNLKHLDLSGNKLGDSGVVRLSAELKDYQCKLEILKLISCGITVEGCSALALCLRLNLVHLRDLTLSGNNLGDSGVNMLSAEFRNTHCKLEILKLGKCGVTAECCGALASVLKLNPSHLRELNLSENNIGDSGVKHISAQVKNPHCKLEILKLWDCKVTDEGCFDLTSALRSNPSHLKHLDLSRNMFDLGVKLLSDLKNYTKLERIYY